MTGYVFSPAARGDLEDIWNYTTGTWAKHGRSDTSWTSARPAAPWQTDRVADGP